MATTYEQKNEIYSIAHTAKCKLHLAADRPDRNLRFILGHAFTLDKLRLRIAEIEEDTVPSPDDILPATARERRVSFRHSPRPGSVGSGERKRSPPPVEIAHVEDEGAIDDDDDEAIEDEEDEDDGLGLRRFESASARPPQMVEDESGSEEDEDEPKSPPPLSEEELKMITGGEGDEGLEGLYKHVAGCPCHGEKLPAVGRVWEIPSKGGERRAVIQVEA